MATTIETQKVHRITADNVGFPLTIPASYDPALTTLQVFRVPPETNVGVPVTFYPEEPTTGTVTPSTSTVGEAVVIRCVPSLDLQFVKNARNALTASEFNKVYKQLVVAMSSVNDKILNEYGITITGDLNLEDKADQTDLDALEDIVTIPTDGLVDKLEALTTVVAGFTTSGTEVPSASVAEARTGTEATKYLSPLTGTAIHDYRETKYLHAVLFNEDDTLPITSGLYEQVFKMKIPKMLDGLVLKAIEASCAVNATNTLTTVSARLIDGVGGTSAFGTAKFNAQALDTDDTESGGALFPATLADSTKWLELSVICDSLVQGLSVGLTFGHTVSWMDV